MSPAISFSVKFEDGETAKDKILSGEKTQTIRPLWVKIPKGMDLDAKASILKLWKHSGVPNRPPRCKVGDTLYLYWKQRSKKVWKQTSITGYYNETVFVAIDWWQLPDGARKKISGKEYFLKRGYKEGPPEKEFPYCPKFYKQIDGSQLLKVTPCTERFEIEIEVYLWEDGGLKGYNANLFGKEFKKAWGKKFAQRDGFKHFNDLVIWLHKKYDLSEPKRFEVIRWA